jgi:flagellar hook-length control protein FliK
VSRADGPTDRTDGPSELAGGTGSDGPGSWTGTDAPAALTASNVVFTLDVRRGDPVATHRLDASPGSVGFGAELGTQITTFIRDGVHHARLELNPGEMGPVTVQIQLDGKAAQVHLAADNADTRRALEQSMPQLATTLREAGLTLSGGGVFEQPRSPQQERAANPSSNPGRSPGAESGTAALDSAAVTPVSARRRGVVDLVA